MNVIDVAYTIKDGENALLERPGRHLSIPERWTLGSHDTEVAVFEVRPLTGHISSFQPVVLLTYNTAGTMEHSSAGFSMTRYMLNRWEAASAEGTVHFVSERFADAKEISGTGECPPLMDFLGYGVKGETNGIV